MRKRFVSLEVRGILSREIQTRNARLQARFVRRKVKISSLELVSSRCDASFGRYSSQPSFPQSRQLYARSTSRQILSLSRSCRRWIDRIRSDNEIPPAQLCQGILVFLTISFLHHYHPYIHTSCIKPSVKIYNDEITSLSMCGTRWLLMFTSHC